MITAQKELFRDHYAFVKGEVVELRRRTLAELNPSSPSSSVLTLSKILPARALLKPSSSGATRLGPYSRFPL